jgi:hypothetical protein
MGDGIAGADLCLGVRRDMSESDQDEVFYNWKGTVLQVVKKDPNLGPYAWYFAAALLLSLPSKIPLQQHLQTTQREKQGGYIWQIMQSSPHRSSIPSP